MKGINLITQLKARGREKLVRFLQRSGAKDTEISPEGQEAIDLYYFNENGINKTTGDDTDPLTTSFCRYSVTKRM